MTSGRRQFLRVFDTRSARWLKSVRGRPLVSRLIGRVARRVTVTLVDCVVCRLLCRWLGRDACLVDRFFDRVTQPSAADSPPPRYGHTLTAITRTKLLVWHLPPAAAAAAAAAAAGGGVVVVVDVGRVGLPASRASRRALLPPLAPVVVAAAVDARFARVD